MASNEEFLETASKLFMENGAKTLTMDEVAREFSISKKTLYQLYKNKEALLEDVLNYQLQKVIEKMELLDSKVENAVARMFCRDEEIDQAVRTNNSMLIRQLIRYYPNIFYSHMKRFGNRFATVLIRNIHRGREQGLYRKDFDEKIYAKLFLQLVMSYDASPFFDEEEKERTDFMEEVILMYMQSITSEEGKRELEKVNK
ncbi:TetR/AcrR family transcriptional regulator [Chryseobacterium sp. A301]